MVVQPHPYFLFWTIFLTYLFFSIWIDWEFSTPLGSFLFNSSSFNSLPSFCILLQFIYFLLQSGNHTTPSTLCIDISLVKFIWFHCLWSLPATKHKTQFSQFCHIKTSVTVPPLSNNLFLILAETSLEWPLISVFLPTFCSWLFMYSLRRRTFSVHGFSFLSELSLESH